MREIYNTKVIGSIEQGTILNSCVAENYAKCSTFGIIITPRCDIDNNKVSTVHYLPIIKFSDWVKVDFWIIFSNNAKKEAINKVISLLEKYKQSRSLIKLFSIDKLREVLRTKITKPDDLTKFNNYLSDLEFLSKEFNSISLEEMKRLVNEYHKISIAVFKDLKEHKRKEFYLLESWDSDKSYYVVLLREIRKITFDMANKISNGIYESQITNIEWANNDINKGNDDDENFIYSIATLKSPHIEHLIQQFFYNFGRIGVENHPANLETDFHKFIENII